MRSLTFAILALLGREAFSSCLSPISGPAVIKVEKCGAVKPEAFRTTDPSTKFIQDLDPNGKKQFFDSYRGQYIKGHVVKTQAFEQGQLGGESPIFDKTIAIFQPSKVPGACSEFTKTRYVLVELTEVCCNGGVESPCLLGTSYVAVKVKPTSPAQEQAKPEVKSTTAAPGQLYAEAQKLYAQGRYKDVVAKLAKESESPDVSNKILGIYAESLYKLEDCTKAIRPLKKIYDNFMRQKAWADEGVIYKRAHFNLAACYSRTNDVTNAVYYLNEFLADPKRFQPEIELSLKHRDFGFIHTSREYSDYKKDAQARLKALKATAR